MSITESQFHESYFRHACKVTTEKDVLITDLPGNDKKTRLRRWWHDWFLLSYNDVRCRSFYTSSNALRIERARQFRHYPGSIHPLSKFSNYWEAFMLVLILANRLVIHQNTSITFGYLHPTGLMLGIVFEVFLFIDFLIRFKIGYIDNEYRKVRLSAKSIRIKYFSTKLFFHVASILPLQTIMLFRFGLRDCTLCKGNKFVCVVEFLSIFGLWRVFNVTKYWTLNQRSFRATYTCKLLRILVLAIISMLQYLTFLDAISVWKAIDMQYIHNKSRFHTLMELRKYSGDSFEFWFSTQFSTITKYLFSYGHHFINGEVYYLDTIAGIIGFIIANLYKIWGFIEWYTVVQRHQSSESRFMENLDMTMNLAKARQVSDNITSRIEKYYDFIVSRTRMPTRRNDLYTLLPLSLHEEMKLTKHYHHVRRIPYFLHWPVEMVENITCLLKEEIFLEADIVAPKWTQGEGLMIVSAGVLAVYNRNDEETGHLIDGDYFGELSLVTDREIRTSSVVAVTPCEILILCKKDFRSYMRRHPELFLALREDMRCSFDNSKNASKDDKRTGGEQSDKENIDPNANTAQRPSLATISSSGQSVSLDRSPRWEERTSLFPGSSSSKNRVLSPSANIDPNAPTPLNTEVTKRQSILKITRSADSEQDFASTGSRRSHIRWRVNGEVTSKDLGKDDKNTI